ncbi:unnamed protein product [Lactuca virosa]|uniref:TIR domain-containing protein n=1 Tax=Lactuca virosa TaxID=75947 RepID=A0AAU9M314_9ASTR|nr:unnamed protein product [Lactuca virosa]
MASSSTSSVHKSFKYDVFLSFRGEDTRTNFVDHLYHALQNKSIHTYKDDEKIKKGKKISDELIGSIEDSKFYIIVFSKNYASSSWCLDELLKIMECHRTTEQTAYPVFYDVEPSEVRKQSGAVGEAFAKYEMEEAAGKWRVALKEAADLAGWELKKTADGHEAKVIQKIVEELSLELRSISFNIDEKLVGMETRIKDLVSSIGIGCDDVRMIGIKGMGGGGKTTLARAVFDYISFQFEGKSFVENVRENVSFSGLKSLQKQVLSDVLNEDIRVSSISDGKYLMKRRLRDKKVLVVLDDVDHIDQLEALAGELNWFKPGSRIIITTRDEQVLVAHRVELIRDVNLLSDKEAICLFNMYAFGREVPIQKYENLSRQVVRYAAGLPLTIRVLGSFLCGKNELEWIDALERLKTIPLTETLKKLELSYIALEEDYKEMFLDVACIMKGWRKDDAIKALECCGFHARNGLRVLEQKSLITSYYGIFDKYKYVGMHDHLEEMGRNIVRRSHPDKPHKHTRLWICEEIRNVLVNNLGTKVTRCLRFDIQNSNREFDMKGYPFRSLPITFQTSKLVSLEMARSKIVQLWEGGERKALNKLRILDLSSSMLSTLDLGLTPNLETLTLQNCSNLVELHMPVECLKLVYVNLGGSKLIRTLDLRLARNLEELIIGQTLKLSNSCNNLEKLQMPNRCLNLQSLVITNSKLRTLDIGQTPNLRNLDLSKNYCLEELTIADECQMLSNLNVSHSKLRTFDLRLTPNLERLDLDRCYNLVELGPPIGNMKKLVHLHFSTLGFGYFSFKVEDYTSCGVDESLEVGPLALLDLTVKSLKSCPLHPENSFTKFQFSSYYREDRPSFTRNLEMLISLGMCACTNLETFSRSICGLQRLRKLKIEGSILEVPKDLYKLECLEELVLSYTEIKHLPDSICMLKHLKSLKIISCLSLQKLPENLGQLECLEKLHLSDTDIERLPDSICMLKNLKSLKKISCLRLQKLPVDLGQLEFLEKLDLSHTPIECLPDSICMLRHLESLLLYDCSLLEKLPKEVGCLECLKELAIEEAWKKANLKRNYCNR